MEWKTKQKVEKFYVIIVQALKTYLHNVLEFT
jgi:hypothetical protein